MKKWLFMNKSKRFDINWFSFLLLFVHLWFGIFRKSRQIKSFTKHLWSLLSYGWMCFCTVWRQKLLLGYMSQRNRYFYGLTNCHRGAKLQDKEFRRNILCWRKLIKGNLEKKLLKKKKLVDMEQQNHHIVQTIWESKK